MIFHFSNASFGITDYLYGVKDMAAIEVNGDLPYKTVQRYPDRNVHQS